MTQSVEKTRPAPRAGARLVDLVGAPPAERHELSPAAIVKIVVLAGLLVLLHIKRLEWLSRKLLEPNWQHGYIIPLFSLYLLWSRREELLAAERRICWLGLPVLLVCLAGEIGTIMVRYPFWLADMFMVGALFGVVLFLAGRRVIRVTWLPILFLAFAIPLPGRIYTQISLPLQNLAAHGAMITLKLLGVTITTMASRLELVSRTGVPRELMVAQACNGMRLLTAFLALGVAAAYLDERPIWQRAVLVVAAMPIAIFCNILRVAITSWMFYIDRQELGQKFMHTLTGLLMLVPAFALLWALGWVMKKLVVTVEDESPEAPPVQAEASDGRATA